MKLKRERQRRLKRKKVKKKDKKGKGKGKKSKKEIQDQKPTSPEFNEVTIKIDDEEDNSNHSKPGDTTEPKSSNPINATADKTDDSDIIKLHEDIVNSQEIILDDEIEEIVKEKDIFGKETVQNTGEQQEKDVDAQDENADDVEKEESDENTAKNNLVNEKKVSDLEIIKDAENNTHPPPTIEYTCKACRKGFDKRPDVIMHIITQHMQDRFRDLPELLNNKYHCPHE